jgi:predicted permease
VVLRVVLGASRPRILAHVLAQSLVVAFVGAAAGAALAGVALAVFRVWGPGGIPRLAEVTLDARAVGFVALVSAGAGLLFGLLPALQASRRAPAEVLRDGGRTATSGRGARGALIIVETAMALVLVLVSGLLVNGFVRLRAVDPGYVADGLMALEVAGLRGRDVDAARVYHERLLDAVRAVPGVRSAALSTFLPYRGFGVVQRYGVEAASGREEPFLPSIIVSDGWMATTGARVVAGRDFESADRDGSAPVILVSEALARRYWPGESDFVGRRIKSGGFDVEDEGWYTIVGVVSDIRSNADDEPVAAVYHPAAQQPWSRFSGLLRVSGNPAPTVAGVRRAVYEVDGSVPIRTLLTARELAAQSLAQPRFYTLLVAGFGVLALLLALVGIYGTTMYATSRRTREIGVRLALGGEPGSVAGLLVREGLRLTLVGVVLGLVGAVAGTRLLQSYLFGVRPTDPATFAATALAVLITAAVAAWIPARRAARLDPSSALRTDAAGAAS